MSNSRLLRIKDKLKMPYKNRKTPSSIKIIHIYGLMTDLGLKRSPEDHHKRNQASTNVCKCLIFQRGPAWAWTRYLQIMSLLKYKKLKEKATLENIKVSGILFLTDMLTKDTDISPGEMISALERLLSSNNRLPKELIKERIEMLKRQNTL